MNAQLFDRLENCLTRIKNVSLGVAPPQPGSPDYVKWYQMKKAKEELDSAREVLLCAFKINAVWHRLSSSVRSKQNRALYNEHQALSKAILRLEEHAKEH